jgi:pimeloyl-ACP methyl ester carboxylesterase
MLRGHRPRVLLAHSLGSVVAYETLSAHPDLGVELFVTLGTPLAMRSVVYDRLSPTPMGRGAKPPGAAAWVNIADRGDPVAVPRRGISQRFQDVARDRDTSIHLIDPHTAKNYLRCGELIEEILPYVTTGSA